MNIDSQRAGPRSPPNCLHEVTNKVQATQTAQVSERLTLNFIYLQYIFFYGK